MKEKSKKCLMAVIAVIIVILLSIGTTFAVLNSRAIKASATVENGLSAYEIAKAYGFEGTVQEWLESLKGKSAYDLAKESGYSGTEEEFSAAAAAAVSNQTVNVVSASFSSEGDLIISLSDGSTINIGKAAGTDGKNGRNGKDGKDGTDGKDGINGHDGVNGKNGADGKDGVSISAANVNSDGQLVLTFTDGSVINLDKVVGSNGADGIGIAKSEINENGELVITYSNGQSANLGNVIGKDGAKGDKGDNGENGADGIGISNAEVNAKGELVVTYSDGRTANLGNVIGAAGAKGDKGDKGDNGEKGEDGVSVASAEINTEGELVISFSNGQRTNVGSVIGAAGAKGDKGEQGEQGEKGDKGDKGDNGIGIKKSEINSLGELVVTYTDDTVANLGAVVGAKGEKGDKGDKGETGAAGQDGVGIENIAINDGKLNITLTNGTTLDLGNIKGADGAKGDKGDKGDKGEAGAAGKDGNGVAGTTINEAGELVITYTNGETVNLGNVVGRDGKDGADGEQGEKGDKGETGAAGEDGNGVAETAINEAGELVITYTSGETANLGKVVGNDGAKGEKGDKGDKGEAGVDGQDGRGISSAAINSDGELVLAFSDETELNLGKIKGEKGDKGEKGETGAAGKDGSDGVGIANVTISDEGNLNVSLTNGANLDLGNIKGEDGIGITRSELNAEGQLLLTYSDGTTTNLGVIVGAKGEKGEKGADGANGADGVGISDVNVLTDGTLVVTLSDGTTKSLGNIKGEKGEKGDNGADGKSAFELYQEANPEYTGTYTEWLESLKGEDGKGIVNIAFNENKELIITYSDGTEQNLGTIASGSGIGGSIGSTVEDDYFIYVLLPDGTYGVMAGAGARQADTLTIPSSYNGIAVSTILEAGFKNCTMLNTVTIPSNIVKIGKMAFYNSGLTYADIADADKWICGITGFNYDFISRSYNSGSTNTVDSTKIYSNTYSISEPASAAAALVGNVRLLTGRTTSNYGYSDSTTEDSYTDFSWYAVDWVKK